MIYFETNAGYATDINILFQNILLVRVDLLAIIA